MNLYHWRVTYGLPAHTSYGRITYPVEFCSSMPDPEGEWYGLHYLTANADFELTRIQFVPLADA